MFLRYDSNILHIPFHGPLQQIFTVNEQRLTRRKLQVQVYSPSSSFLSLRSVLYSLLRRNGRHGDLSTRRDITDIVDSAPVVVCLGEIAAKGTVVNLGSNVSHHGAA